MKWKQTNPIDDTHLFGFAIVLVWLQCKSIDDYNNQTVQ